MKGPHLVGNKGQPTVYLFLVHPVYMHVCEWMCIYLWVNVTHLGIFFFFTVDVVRCLGKYLTHLDQSLCMVWMHKWKRLSLTLSKWMQCVIDVGTLISSPVCSCWELSWVAFSLFLYQSETDHKQKPKFSIFCYGSIGWAITGYAYYDVHVEW